MPPHSLGSGTISFGLVSIPVKMYTAASSASVSFNLLHAKCGSRIKQQTFCPPCNETVERTELVKGYEFAKDQYVRFDGRRAEGARGRGVEDHRHRRVRAARPGRPDLLREDLLPRPRQGRREGLPAARRRDGRRPSAWRWPSSSCAARRAWCSSAPPRTGSCCTPCTSPTRCATSARSTRASRPRSRTARSSWPAAHRRAAPTTTSSPSSTTTSTASACSTWSNQKVEGKEITVAEAPAPRAR